MLAGTVPVLGAGALALRGGTVTPAAGAPRGHAAHDDGHASFRGGAVDNAGNGFDPHALLRDFDWGSTSRLPSGRVLREWTLVAGEQDVELAPGIRYAAWSYNGRIPGPTLRAREGERLRVTLVNGSPHPHTIHFHGLHLYHCHVRPLAEHIAKGLYGAFIVDPADAREEADELVMVMNGFDTNFDRANELYAANTIGFAYMDRPIVARRGELVRVYLVNVLEYDLVNSFHLHGNLFNYFPTGTSKQPSELTDTVMLCQGQRGVIEVCFEKAGKFMFHAHQSEFTELGWLGFFEVVD